MVPNTINIHVVRALMSRFCLLRVHGVNIMVWGMRPNSYRRQFEYL